MLKLTILILILISTSFTKNPVENALNEKCNIAYYAFDSEKRKNPDLEGFIEFKIFVKQGKVDSINVQEDNLYNERILKTYTRNLYKTDLSFLANDTAFKYPIYFK